MSARCAPATRAATPARAGEIAAIGRAWSRAREAIRHRELAPLRLLRDWGRSLGQHPRRGSPAPASPLPLLTPLLSQPLVLAQTHALIECCLQADMGLKATVDALAALGVAPRVTRIVWSRLEAENAAWFAAYRLRLAAPPPPALDAALARLALA